MNVIFKTNANISKPVFFDYIYPITASAFMTSVNDFCNTKPGKCCKSGGSESYKKATPEKLDFVTKADIRATAETPILAKETLSALLYVMPSNPNPLCSSLTVAKKRKRRAASSENEKPLKKSTLAEVTKDMDVTQLAKNISASLLKNLNIKVEFMVTISSTTVAPLTRIPPNNAWKTPVVAVFAILLVAVVCVAVVLVIRRYNILRSGRLFRNAENEEEEAYSNPVYATFGVSETEDDETKTTSA